MDRQNESRANNEDLRNEQNTQMLETGIGADVFFLVGEEKELIAGHKSVLEEGSPVFEAQFRHGNSNVLVSVGSREKPIEVPDVRPNAFDAMIRFIHTRELRGMNKQIVLDVYVAGKKYMIDALVNQCRQWLLNNGQSLDVKNVLAVLKFAQFHEDKVLIKHCWSFMHKNAKAVIDSEDFLLLEEADLREMFSPAPVSALFESFDWYRPTWFSRDAKAHLLDTGKGANMHFLVGEEKEIKLKWSNNKWHISDQKIVHANGLTIVKTIENANRSNVRTQHPVSCALLALIPADQKLVYWEVQMKKESASDIGWVGPNFSLNDECIGYHPDSFAITRNGNYWESGCYFGGHGKGFGIDDVVGSGLLLTREGRPKLFFTLNGRLNGEPIVLKESPDRLLFPAVTLYYKDTSVEVNFGADLENKPFKFDVKAHVTELFD